MYDVAHGAGLAALWGSWARYVYREIPERFHKFAVRVMGLEDTPVLTSGLTNSTLNAIMVQK